MPDIPFPILVQFENKGPIPEGFDAYADIWCRHIWVRPGFEHDKPLIMHEAKHLEQAGDGFWSKVKWELKRTTREGLLDQEAEAFAAQADAGAGLLLATNTFKRLYQIDVREAVVRIKGYMK